MALLGMPSVRKAHEACIWILVSKSDARYTYGRNISYSSYPSQTFRLIRKIEGRQLHHEAPPFGILPFYLVILPTLLRPFPAFCGFLYAVDIVPHRRRI